MYRKTIKYVFILNFLTLGLAGQDLHFSQFFNSPLNLSPSMTGYFNGEARYHANYRNQWSSIPVDYISADVGVDFKFRNYRNSNYFAVGGLINYDMAGDLNLSLTGLNGFFAYSLELGNNSRVSPAIMVSFAQRRFDAANATSGNQWDGRAYDPNIPVENIGADTKNFLDFGAGLNYRWQSAYRSFFDLGVSAYHLLTPSESFNPDANYDSSRPMRFSVYGLFNFPVANRLDILLNAVHTRQEEFRESVGNFQLKFYLGEKQSAAFYLGGGYRLDDAWYPMVAIELGAVYGAFSYDLTISDFEEINDGRGGPEFTLRYIIARIPQGINKPCPLY